MQPIPTLTPSATDAEGKPTSIGSSKLRKSGSSGVPRDTPFGLRHKMKDSGCLATLGGRWPKEFRRNTPERKLSLGCGAGGHRWRKLRCRGVAGEEFLHVGGRRKVGYRLLGFALGSRERNKRRAGRTDQNAGNGGFVGMMWSRATDVHTAPCARFASVSWLGVERSTVSNEHGDWLLPFLAVVIAAEEESNKVVRTRATINRDRQEALERLVRDYFADKCLYDEATFATNALESRYEYMQQRPDARENDICQKVKWVVIKVGIKCRRYNPYHLEDKVVQATYGSYGLIGTDCLPMSSFNPWIAILKPRLEKLLTLTLSQSHELIEVINT
ncbi:hypothetical protein LXL04_009516 [Taraxacum kok-saghyz]